MSTKKVINNTKVSSFFGPPGIMPSIKLHLLKMTGLALFKKIHFLKIIQ